RPLTSTELHFLFLLHASREGNSKLTTTFIAVFTTILFLFSLSRVEELYPQPLCN
ncbi:hypothetical protein KUCAC02_024807, partial [Chaenocephalus aceratus]